MKSLIKKESFILLVIILAYAFSVAPILRFLYPMRYDRLNLFFSELLGKPIYIPFLLTFLSALGSIIFLTLIARRIFPGKNYLIATFIYCISPWSLYLTVSQSFYIFLTFLLLIFCYSILLIKENHKFLGSLLFIISAVLVSYSSFLLFITLPLLIIGVLITKYINLRAIKKNLIISFISVLPLFLLILNNRIGFENVSKNQIKIFQNPGLTNSINVFMGESTSAGFRILSKLTENKYAYFSKYMLMKLIKNIVPTTYFTPQEKLLGFSFSPPIYMGFMLPFLFGVYLLLNSEKLRKYLSIFVVLIMPSFLSGSIVDLNRLLITQPVIIFIICYGLIRLKENIRSIPSKIFLFLIITLVFIQYLTSFSDIVFREYPRYQRIFKSNLEIGKQ